jgi:hypothetical protein
MVQKNMGKAFKTSSSERISSGIISASICFLTSQNCPLILQRLKRNVLFNEYSGGGISGEDEYGKDASGNHRALSGKPGHYL